MKNIPNRKPVSDNGKAQSVNFNMPIRFESDKRLFLLKMHKGHNTCAASLYKRIFAEN